MNALEALAESVRAAADSSDPHVRKLAVKASLRVLGVILRRLGELASDLGKAIEQ